jgi:hypothetical protein
MLENKITKDHPLVVPEGFKADSSAYDSIVTDFNEELDIVMKKIKYVNGDAVKWCTRIVMEAEITKGLKKGIRFDIDIDEEYYFIQCKEVEGNGNSLRAFIGSVYIQGIIDNGEDPYEVFGKGKTIQNESFYEEVDGKILPRNQASRLQLVGVKITKALPLVVPEGFVTDKSAYDLIVTEYDDDTGITMKKIRYALYSGTGDDKKELKYKWCVRLVQDAVITKGLAKATSKKTVEDYHFFECKEIDGNASSMNLLVSSNYIQGIIDKGQDPYEIFAKGEEVYSESFYVEVNGKFYPVTILGFEITDETIVNVLDYLEPELIEYHTSESLPTFNKIEEIRNKTQFNNDKKNIYETDDDLDNYNLKIKSSNTTNFEETEKKGPKKINKFLFIVSLIISFVVIVKQIGPIGAVIGDMAVPVVVGEFFFVAGILHKIFIGDDFHN